MSAASEIKNGIVCFTFDDRSFEGWIKALPIFEKYNAHATFFIAGEIDDEAIEYIKLIASKGHTVGLHSLEHMDAPEFFDAYGANQYYEMQIKKQLDACIAAGIEINSFAYPNNKRNEEADKALGGYFKRFRAGILDAEHNEIFIPVSDLSEYRVMRGFGVGEYYNTKTDEMLKKIKYAADENVCITFFSHNIEKGATHINMPTEMLDACLSTASNRGVKILGFDELY